MIEKHIEKLAELLKNKTIKSQQTAFNLCLEDIKKAKDIASWKTIALLLSEKTNIHFSEERLWTLYSRSKKKQKDIKDQVKKLNKIDEDAHIKSNEPIKGFFSQSNKSNTVNHDSTATMDKFKDKYL